MSDTTVIYEDLTVVLPHHEVVQATDAAALDALEDAAFEAACQAVHGLPFAEFVAACDAARETLVAEQAKPEAQRNPAAIEAAQAALAAMLARRPAPPALPEKE